MCTLFSNLITYTVSAVHSAPLVHHDRRSVRLRLRQKQDRLRARCLTALTTLSLTLLAPFSGALLAQQPPVRDTIPDSLKVLADSAVRARAERSRLLNGTAAREDTGAAARAAGQGPFAPLGAAPDLAFRLNSRLEGRYQRNRNDRCNLVQTRVAGVNCYEAWTPNFDFQFDVRSNGVVADRVHVNLDFNSQNEYTSSNNISVRYEGKPGRLFERVEVGNISFLPPPSRFISSGIPANNYGVQAQGKIGTMRYTAVAAQQKGNVIKDIAFTIGDRNLQQQKRAIEDVGMELRRFFMTVDPRVLPGYPNIDILNRPQMQRVAASLPDSIRPVRLYIYKQLIGATNPNPRGPQLSVRGARNSTRQIYEVLRENVDYYVDPSQLWIALVAPLAQNERLAVAYEVNVNGVPGRNINTGGTPDVEYTVANQFANLLWEPELQPTEPNGYFLREIKSVYRLGGDDIRQLRRETIAMRIVTGTSGDQEKPQNTSRGGTFLQVFGMSQVTNPGAFDVENRVWPRPQDPNQIAGAPTSKLIRDNYIVFPSLQPFARAGLAQPLTNPANDTLYTYPNEYLYSSQRPQSIFRMMVDYLTEGVGGTGTLELGAPQVRPFSERVVVDGVVLVRDVDYTANYDLGVINFTRPDTLFLQPRQVVVKFEENQTRSTSPTAIFGWTSQLPFEHGEINFTAISQRQRSLYNRPPLGQESMGSLVAGITANLHWDATALTRAVSKLPFRESSVDSRIGFLGEIALSKPNPNSAGQAYLATFETNAGRTIQLADNNWQLSSQPAAGNILTGLLGGTQLALNRNTTLAYQSLGRDPAGNSLQFTIDQIDPQVTLARTGVLQAQEPALWLTLFPLSQGGLLGTAPGSPVRRNAWTVGSSTALGPTPSGRRWGSIRTVLNPSGDDLSNIENIEFFALISTDRAKRAKNPTLVLDIGDISENRVAFTPETLYVAPGAAGQRPDTTYRGKRLSGYDRFDSERDRFSRAFNALDNDVGIAGSVADSITVVDRSAGSPSPYLAEKVPLCTAQVTTLLYLGDSRANCSVRNNRLDEEDIDLDGQLNLTSANADREQWKRFVVNLADTTTWNRVGRCRPFVVDSSATFGVTTDTLCWVQVRLNWRAPNDSLNAPSDRRMRAMRLTMVSAAGESDDAYTRIALSKFELIGAPWLRRSTRPLAGIAGDSVGAPFGYVISSVIGTQDSTDRVRYQPPPGVIEATETRAQLAYDNTLQQINEHSLRMQAGVPGGQLPVFTRAESYFRFPQGNNTFMGYRTLRLWMRGRGNGWGTGGELNAFVKVGRDENNFYLYRTEVQAGETAAAWEPEIRVDLTRFQMMRAQLENNSLRNAADSLSCTGADLELIKRSGLPRAQTIRRFAVCQGGYIVYTADPGITPPNLAGVQELAVGFVRMDSVSRGMRPIQPGDSLELWIDDVRLSDVVADVGFAGEVALFGNAGDLADFRLNLVRRDPNFRQLGETPTFLTSSGVLASTTVHLERLLPQRWGIVMPLTVSHGSNSVDQMFINQTDVRADGIRGLRSPRDSRTDYALSIRRRDPLSGRWYAPLLNGLTLSGLWGGGSGQSTYQESSNNNYAVTAAIDIHAAPIANEQIASDSVAHRLPGVLDWLLGALPGFLRESESVRGLRAQQLRWRPARFQLLSGVSRNSSTTVSFVKPVALASDTGVAYQQQQHLWQNSSTLEFRPINAISVSLTARQMMDLRNYDNLSGVADSAARATAARAERASLFGANVGLERERAFTTYFDFRPGINNWLQPSFRFGGNFSLYRDPNARALLRDASDTTLARLPKRLGALQTMDAGLLLELGRLIQARNAETSRRYRLGRAILPFNVAWTRALSSNYDNTLLNPGAGYQFGFGGMGSFRGLNSQLATGAGRLSALTASAGVQLPLSFTLSSRYQRGSSETWTRRVLDNVQALITTDNQTLPDAELRWSLLPVKPNKLFSGITAAVGYVVTESDVDVRNETGRIVERGRTRTESQPMSLQVNWAMLDGFRTGAIVTRSLRVESRPGSVTRNDNPLYQSYSVGKDFTLPANWKARSRLKTTASYVSEGAISIVQDFPGVNGVLLGVGAPSVLTNNGRRQYNFSADTDLSETMSFSFTGSHTTVFDRNFNRQNSITVFSTVLQLHFGAGELK
ncbi:MAG: cell surface protein SprA [Gemmatimonas sp.]